MEITTAAGKRGDRRAAPTARQLVEDAVEAHFAEHSQEIAESIRERVEELQLRMLNVFFETVRDRYAGRIAALEAITARNRECTDEIRLYAGRADDDLRRLAAGIEHLLEDAGKARPPG